MRQTLVSVPLSALLLLCSTPALADPISILTNSTGIAAQVYTGERGVITTKEYPFTPNGNNAVTVSAATGGSTASASTSVASDVTDLSLLRGNGSTQVAYQTQIGEGFGSATTSFFVAFELASAHEYRFAADFVTSGGATFIPTADWTEWQFDLMSLDPGRSHEPALMIDVGHHSTSVVRSGLLAPGLYRFFVQGTALAGNLSALGPNSGSGFSNFAFTLGLTPLGEPPTPTPEPASMLLIGTGLAGLFAARRRLKRPGSRLL